MNTETRERFEALLSRYLDDRLAPKEEQELHDLLASQRLDGEFFEFARLDRELSALLARPVTDEKMAELVLGDVRRGAGRSEAEGTEVLPDERSAARPDIHYGTGIHKFVPETGRPRPSSSRRRALRRQPVAIFSRPHWPILAAACVLAGVVLYFTLYQGAGLFSVVPPQAAVGKVVFLVELKKEQGEVPILVRGSGAKQTRKALAVDMELFPGDRIETPPASPSPSRGAANEKEGETRPVQVALEFLQGVTVDLADATIFECLDGMSSRLERGLLYVDVLAGSRKKDPSAASRQKAKKENSPSGIRNPNEAAFDLVFRTPFADAKTQEARFELRAEDTEAVVRVEEGKVLLTNARGDLALLALQQSTARKESAPWPAEALQAEALWRGRKDPAATVLAGTAFFEVENFGTARGIRPADGKLDRLFVEALPGAAGGRCVAAPKKGAEISATVNLKPGAWFLWIRYRDDTQGKPSFEVECDGRALGQVVAPGLREGAWEWRRLAFQAKDSARIVLRSTFDGVRAGKGDGGITEHPYAAVVRWDRICMTNDANFKPAEE